MAVLVSKGIIVPLLGKLLSDFAEGEIVKINENGTPAEFYVAKHDYESDLNGTGRTLLVRKNCYNSRQWHSSDINAYATSSIDAWFNSSYKALHDSTVQALMGSTKFYYTIGNGTTTKTTLERAVFALSATELGLTPSTGYYNKEGSTLGIAATLKIAYLNETAVYQWTRTPNIKNKVYAYCSTKTGGYGGEYCSNQNGSRPCFTLPSNALFDSKTFEFKGVI